MMTTQAEQHFQATMFVMNQPRPADVLCGRGKDSFRHEGNQRFRCLIAEHATTYKLAATKKQKMQVVMLVADIVIARGGRFLVRDKNGNWMDGGRNQGRKKTGHSFRDALRGRVKCISQIMKRNQDNASLTMSDDCSSDDSSGIYSACSDEHDFENATKPTADVHAEIIASFDFEDVPAVEPSKEWRNPTMDKQLGMEVANDLLDLLITDYIR